MSSQIIYYNDNNVALRHAQSVFQAEFVADHLSLGDMSAEEFPRHEAEEIASVSRDFNRMRKSLEKALRMLEK